MACASGRLNGTDEESRRATGSGQPDFRRL